MSTISPFPGETNVPEDDTFVPHDELEVATFSGGWTDILRSSFTWRSPRSTSTKNRFASWSGQRGVVLVTLVIQSLMVAWTYRHGLIYGFGDSLSHMTIARRLWDSPNPGLSQLGTTWLPLPHLFFAIGSISMWAWKTGLGGSLFTVGCALVTSASLYVIGLRTGVGKTGGWLAAMIVATNPSWSFLSAVPMTEPFTVALICLSVAGLLRWSQSERPYSAGMTALFCGLPVAAGILTRFEGWTFALVAGLCVTWISWRRHGWTIVARRQILAFATLPAIAMFWWFIFNWSIYGNPLAFENGQYSSKATISPAASLGLIYGKGNLPAATALYGKDILDIAGTAVVVIAVIGLCVTAARWRGLGQEIWLCLSGVSVLIVLAIWQGQIYIRLPQMTPPGYLNTRYGTEMLPFLAVAAAQTLRIFPQRLAKLRRHALERVLAVVLLSVMSGQWFLGVASGALPANAVTVREASTTLSFSYRERQIAKWLHHNATTGYILLDESIFPIIPLIGFDLHRVVVTSEGSTFRRLLRHPLLVTWVAVDVGNVHDAVWVALQSANVFNTAFFPVVTYGNFTIFKQETLEQKLPANRLLHLPPTTNS